MSSQPKRNDAADSGELTTAAALGLIPDAPQHMSFGKIIGIVASILGILVVIMGTPLFVVKRVEASAATTRKEMKESLDVHADVPHKGAVSKDVYVEHVKLADERHSESKAERQKILGKLDKLLERK